MLKITPVVILMILGVRMLSSEQAVHAQESDSIGRLPEMVVTASRHALHDAGWAGMLEEVVVTARRPSTSIHSVHSTGTYFNNNMYLVVLLTFLLVTLSILYMSLHGYVTAKEKNHAGSRH